MWIMTALAEVVRELYSKLTAGDASGALALMTDDVEWVPMMDYKVDGRGPQNILEEMLIPAMTEWVTFILTPSEFVAGRSDTVLSIGRFQSTHRATDKIVEVNYAHAWEVQDGKIARLGQYIDTAEIEARRTRNGSPAGQPVTSHGTEDRGRAFQPVLLALGAVGVAKPSRTARRRRTRKG
jgi:hypothetical protein